MEELLLGLKKAAATELVKSEFQKRIEQGRLTRDENPESHVCVFFAAYDPKIKKVFIGDHKKSGLYLFNGGHLDKGESIDRGVRREISEEWGKKIVINEKSLSKPRLLTIQKIENASKQKCKIHFDIWFFVEVNEETFKPDQALLAKEFNETMWVSISDAKNLKTSTEMMEALNYIQNNIFI